MVPDTDSIQPCRRTGRRVTIILLIVFVLVAGWAWLWKFAASRAETAVAGWRAREARAGRVYSCGTQSVGGFPFRIELTCGKASALLRSKATPLVEIRTPSVLVGADLYQPDTLTSRFVGPLTVGAPGKPPGIWVNWTFAQSTVHGTPSAPERVTLEFERPTVDRIVGGKHQSLLSARRIALEGRIASGSPSDHPVIEVSLKAVRASAPGLHPAAAPPINMHLAARLTGLADFAPKPWAERFREMQAAGGRIEITHARIKQGNTLAVGKGSLSIDANGQLAGQLSVTVAGLKPFLDAIGAGKAVAQSPNMDKFAGMLDRLSPGLGDVARQQAGANLGLGISMLGKPATLNGRRAVTLPLRFADGVAYLGPIPLGPTPALF
ncbi:MAG: DUF2125 domain-containing protein [Pseudolabrys sp.]